MKFIIIELLQTKGITGRICINDQMKCRLAYHANSAQILQHILILSQSKFQFEILYLFFSLIILSTYYRPKNFLINPKMLQIIITLIPIMKI
jgi:hypothetical protein